MSRAQIIDGKAVAARVLAQAAKNVAALKDRGVAPGLAVILVGDNPASAVYVSNKIKACGKTGIASFHHALPATAAQKDLMDLIARLNADKAVHGILLQMPLPAGFDANAALATIDPAKDVDGLHPLNIGRLAAGLPGLAPCTPQGIVMLVKEIQRDLAGLHAVVVGRSLLVGKPVAQMLLAENCTVTQVHSRSRDLPALCAQGGILVVAAGKPRMVTKHWIKKGAIVIDVGINRLADGKLAGDVDFDEAAAVARAITPVPGGVGPMTVACLMANAVKAAGG